MFNLVCKCGACVTVILPWHELPSLIKHKLKIKWILFYCYCKVQLACKQGTLIQLLNMDMLNSMQICLTSSPTKNRDSGTNGSISRCHIRLKLYMQVDNSTMPVRQAMQVHFWALPWSQHQFPARWILFSYFKHTCSTIMMSVCTRLLCRWWRQSAKYTTCTALVDYRWKHATLSCQMRHVKGHQCQAFVFVRLCHKFYVQGKYECSGTVQNLI